MARLIMGRGVATDESCRDAVRGLQGDPGMDQDLRELVARCLALIPDNRPRLAILLQRVLDLFRARTAAFYADTPTAQMETDENIQKLFQTCVLNGST